MKAELEACPICGNEERGQGGYFSCECPAQGEKGMSVFILSAEHFSTPGLILQAHASHASAVSEAVELVNIMLKDSGWQPLASPIQWQHHLERLQDTHGAAHCYVEITETGLRGNARP